MCQNRGNICLRAGHLTRHGTQMVAMDQRAAALLPVRTGGGGRQGQHSALQSLAALFAHRYLMSVI